MPHTNASLTERGRLKLARCVVDEGWTLRRAAQRFQVSHNTAHRPAAIAGRTMTMILQACNTAGCSRELCPDLAPSMEFDAA